MSHRWTDHRSTGVAASAGKYPFQFVFDQDGAVFHHHTARDRHRDLPCHDAAREAGSDMTFSAALKDALYGDREPCPDCLSAFPTTEDALTAEHFPDKARISFEEVQDGMLR